MAGLTDEVPEVPIVEVEVDDINPEVVDPNEALYDEEGKITSYLDVEQNKRFVRKAAAPVAPVVPPTEKPIVPDDKIVPGEEEEEITDNAAEYILRRSGYDKEDINLGGEGDQANLVKIKDLSPEQQMDIVVSEFDRTVDKYEARIKELETKAPELKFENPVHQQIVDFLKDGGDVQKLAKQLLSNDPAAQAKMMTDQEIVKLGIKKEFAEFTDEEVEAELKDMSPEKVARRAKALRTRFEKEVPNIDNLTLEQKNIKLKAANDLRTEYETESKSVRDYLSKAKNVAGVPVNEEMKSFLASRVIPENENGDSEFLKGLNSPEKLIRLEFLDRYHEKIRQSTQDFYYKKGINDAAKMKVEELEKYSKEPLRTYNISPAKKESKVPKSVDEIEDWAAFAAKSDF